MKKHLFFAIGLCIAFCACKKEVTPANQNHVDATTDKSSALYDVGFNLTGFTTETKGISSSKLQTNSVLGNSIKYLSYYVYNGSLDSLKLVKKIDQKYTDSNFGSIKDSLRAGHYVIIFVGSKSGNYQLTTAFDLFALGTYVPALQYKNDNKFGDTFSARIDIDVKTSVKQNIVLKRIVSMVTFKLHDQLPADVYKIVVGLDNAVPKYDILYDRAAYDGTHGLDFNPRYEEFILTDSQKGKTDLEFSTYVWPFSNYLTPSIKAYSKTGVLLAQKIINDPNPNFILSVEANTQYILAGYLFGVPLSKFTISVDGKWDPPQNSTF